MGKRRRSREGREKKTYIINNKSILKRSCDWIEVGAGLVPGRRMPKCSRTKSEHAVLKKSSKFSLVGLERIREYNGE